MVQEITLLARTIAAAVPPPDGTRRTPGSRSCVSLAADTTSPKTPPIAALTTPITPHDDAMTTP